MSRDRRTALALGLVALLGGPALAAPPRVGVVVSLAVNMEEDESNQLAVALADALRDKLVVDVIAGNEVARRMPPDGVPEDCVMVPDCVKDLGARLEADQLLLLVLAKVGTSVQVDSTWADVASGRSVSRTALQIEEGGAPAGEVFRAAAHKLLPDATVRTAAEIIPPGNGNGVGPGPGPVDTPPAGRRFTTPFWISAGMGGAALVGGLGLGVVVRGDYNELEDRGCPDSGMCTDDEIDSLERKALIADLLVGTAVVAGAAAAFFYFTSAPDEPPPPVTVNASPNSVVLGFGGTF